VDFLVSLHSFWRWAVLLAGVVALVGAVGGLLGALPPQLAARRAATFYTISLDIQLLTGLILWVGRGWYAAPGGYFRLEHPLTMLLAIVVAHAGQVMARRASAPAGAARVAVVATLVSLVLVILGIPGVVRGG
jgi:hypothetical protein